MRERYLLSWSCHSRLTRTVLMAEGQSFTAGQPTCPSSLIPTPPHRPQVKRLLPATCCLLLRLHRDLQLFWAASMLSWFSVHIPTLPNLPFSCCHPWLHQSDHGGLLVLMRLILLGKWFPSRNAICTGKCLESDKPGIELWLCHVTNCCVGVTFNLLQLQLSYL